jgi:hypothetical protein
MTHEFASYSDEEKKEFLARARLLKHDFVYGDWAWHPDGVFLIYEIHPSNAMFRSSDGIMDIPEKPKPLTLWESWVWLPSLNDLLRMDGWKDYFLTSDFFHQRNTWVVLEDHRGIEDGSALSEANHLCLAALRAIQRCEGYCGRCAAKEIIQIDPCVGIHNPDGPHRCTGHWERDP